MRPIKNFPAYLLWVVSATIWIALTAIMPDFLDNPVYGVRGISTIVCYIGAISVVSFFVLYIFGINKYIAAVFYPLYGILGAGVSYYRVAYRVTITPLIIDCVLHTNTQEAMSVISWQMVVWIILNLCISILFVLWRWQLQTPKYAYVHVAVALLLLIGYYHVNSRLHQSINQRYPMHIVESLRMYRVLQHDYQQERTTPIYTCNTVPIDSLDIVVIIGESMRADHLQLNGYHRETNPLLSQRNNIVSYPHIHSLYTHTLASVPVILTRSDSLHPEYQYSETSFATIFRKQGFHTAWISNQDMGETFAHFPAECDTALWVNAGKSTFVFSGWYDEELLPFVDKQMALNHPRNVFILHTIGSHWYYNNHVPDTHNYFQPITNDRVVTNNTLEQVINSYDNTARYMDLVVDSVIQRLENRCAVVFYLSDHGESLGENGYWLHAAGAEETKIPACFIWFSDKYAQIFPNKINALHQNSTHRYLTDFLYHSVLSAADIYIQQDTIDISKDIFTTSISTTK